MRRSLVLGLIAVMLFAQFVFEPGVRAEGPEVNVALDTPITSSGTPSADASHANVTNAADTVPPAAITDLTAFNANIRSVELTWTAPGDDGMSGTAASYDVRYSTSPITEANWNAAEQALDELKQLPAGTTMRFQVNELAENTTYYFAVKTTDDASNVSALSNVVSATTFTPTPDSVTVTSLAALQQAINNAPASGRIITLAAGTYNQTSTINITNKNNITIQGATNDYSDTVLNGPGITGSLDINIKVNRSDYVTLRNFTTQNTSAHGVQVNSGSDYFRADNMKTWDHGEGGFKTSAINHSQGAPYSDYGIIENSVIGYTTTGRLSSVVGVNLIATRGWIVRNNYVTNTFRPDRLSGTGIFAKGGAIDTIIENNYLYNNFIPISFGGGGTDEIYFRNGDTTYEHIGGVIRNNVIYKTGDTGIYLAWSQGYKVFNNTVLDTTLTAVQSRWTGTHGEIRNNLMNKGIQNRNGGTHTASNNITNASYSMFVSVANEDFHLNPATAAAAIDAGMNLPEVLFDMDGDARPSGASTDIGADEVVQGSPPAPAAPTNLAAVGGDGEVGLTWTASTGATGYNVKRSTSNGGPYATIAPNVTATAYTDTSVTNGTTYYYVVSAVNAVGESANSSQASATPSAPPTGGETPLDRSGWQLHASNTSNMGRAIDGNLGTRWTPSAMQAPNQFFQINLGAQQTFNKIELDSGPSWPRDYPEGYEVFVSNNGSTWTSVTTGAGDNRVTTITFPAQTAQYIRIVLTQNDGSWWSISEINVYTD